MKNVLICGIAGMVLQLCGIRPCLFYGLFHVPCPGCGITRSLICLVKGDVTGSLNYNPIGIGIVIYMAILFLKGAGQSRIEDRKTCEKNLPAKAAVSIALLILLEIHNLNNPLLY